MKYLKIDTCDIANGKHLGAVLWVSGCDLRCPGCHNQASWDFELGQEFTLESYKTLFEVLSQPYIKRFTISGGHPLAPANRNEVYKILKAVRNRFPGLEIWLYTGYTITNEDFFSKYSQTFAYCDYVVDGAYIEKLRDITLPFRGSSNQRIIDVTETFCANEIKTIVGEEHI